MDWDRQRLGRQGLGQTETRQTGNGTETRQTGTGTGRD